MEVVLPLIIESFDPSFEESSGNYAIGGRTRKQEKSSPLKEFATCEESLPRSVNNQIAEKEPDA
jgi:hypothetical protein